MLKVRVTKADIRKGRTKASNVCGCPVWLAIKRSIDEIAEEDDNALEIPDVTFAKFGRFKLNLPRKAVVFQNKLMRDFTAKVMPFSFSADVEIGPKEA